MAHKCLSFPFNLFQILHLLHIFQSYYGIRKPSKTLFLIFTIKLYLLFFDSAFKTIFTGHEYSNAARANDLKHAAGNLSRRSDSANGSGNLLSSIPLTISGDVLPWYTCRYNFWEDDQ